VFGSTDSCNEKEIKMELGVYLLGQFLLKTAFQSFILDEIIRE
jgi:hypothetical protein